MADGLQVVSAGLFYTLVCVDGGVTSSTSQVLAVFVGNVFAFRVLVALRKAEVNNVHRVFGLFCAADQKVVRLDIAVDNALLVHLFDTLDHLVRN